MVVDIRVVALATEELLSVDEQNKFIEHQFESTWEGGDALQRDFGDVCESNIVDRIEGAEKRVNSRWDMEAE